MWFNNNENVMEYNMNEAKEKADSNLSKYLDTNEEEYLDNYYKYRDEYRQYNWKLNK